MQNFESIMEKLKILTDAAKYDVSCSSSGHERRGQDGHLGSSAAMGICHTWTADGRCVSLLKVLYTNKCVYDCAYCINRRSNDVPRAAFTPREALRWTAVRTAPWRRSAKRCAFCARTTAF